MMSRVCLIVQLVLLVSNVGISQEVVQESPPELRTVDVLYTVNGSMWRGTIKSWGDDTIVFETLNGLELTFTDEEVLRVRQRLVRTRSVPRPYAFPHEGLYQVLQFAISSGPEGGISATYAIGYRLSRMLGIGIGAGFENFELDEGKYIIPIFIEARGFMREAKLSPYYAMRLGYGIASINKGRREGDARGGVLISPEIGIRFGGNHHANFYMGLGAHFQKAEYRIQWPWNENRIIDRVWYQRTELKFGLVF